MSHTELLKQIHAVTQVNAGKHFVYAGGAHGDGYADYREYLGEIYWGPEQWYFYFINDFEKGIRGHTNPEVFPGNVRSQR